MAEQVRIGFIGCGDMARFHMKTFFTSVPEAQIVALCDPSDEQIKRCVEAFPSLKGLPVFKDYREMLEKVVMDAVTIITPHTQHFQQAMDALDKGLHVLIEKPMVCSTEHAKILVDRFKETGKVGLVAYQRHYAPQFRYIKQSIESGKVGEVQFVSALQCQGWYKGTKGTWRQEPELSGGGQLNDSGSHLVDIILWTTGLMAQTVTAFTENFDSKVDINSALSIKFRNGALGNISIVGNAPAWHEDISFWCSEGMFLYRNGHLQFVDASGKRHDLTEKDMPAGSSPGRNFVDAILKGVPVESPPECGLRVIEMTEAAWKSAAQNGMPVTV
jgi:predicted dehydrogenase